MTSPQSHLDIPGLVISGATASDIEGELTKLRRDQASLKQRLRSLEDALEYTLRHSRTEETLQSRVKKIEETINSLTLELVKDQQIKMKLDGALPKITSAVNKMQIFIEQLQEKVRKLKGGNEDEVDRSEEKKRRKEDDDEEDDSFASASEEALDREMKKGDKLKPMDHGGRKVQIVRTVFEEIDDGSNVEYKMISQALRKD